MSGHSKWSQIKRQKGIADARRGMMFTKLNREIELAVRQGGPDLQANFRLRLSVQKAKDHRMPWENIERAIKRGSGGGEGQRWQEITLEGYGPKGVAIFIEATTDNRNRTIQDIRATLSRFGGNLAESGAVSWLFELRGVITLDVNQEQGEEIALKAIDAGAEDVKVEQNFVEVFTRPEDMERVRRALEAANQPVAAAELSRVPKMVVPLDGEAAQSTLKLLDRVEELEDVQRLYSNADFSLEALELYRESLA